MNIAWYLCVVFLWHVLAADTDGVESVTSGLDVGGRWCHCWNNTDTDDVEVECRCHGIKLTSLPKKLPDNVEKMTVSDAGLEVLGKNSFQKYRKNLQDM